MSELKNKTLLSICIPTYNRSEYLDISLKSMIDGVVSHQGEVEVIVSDNASTDNTKEIVKKYSDMCSYIRYHKNIENIEDMNYPTAISKAKGVYRKLLNDTSVLTAESIKYIVKAVKDNIKEKPVLFFVNNNIKKNNCEIKKLFSLEEFVEEISYYSTWIGSFGIWESDFFEIEDKFAGCDRRFWQTENLFKTISVKSQVIVYPKRIIQVQNVVNKNLGYGVYNVYINNYLGIINFYVENGFLKKQNLKTEERRLLFGYFGDHFINMIFTPARYSKNGWDGLNIFYSFYKKRCYFYIFPFYVLLRFAKRIPNKIKNIF